MSMSIPTLLITVYNVSVVVDVDAELDESSVDDVAQSEDTIVSQSRTVLPVNVRQQVQSAVDEIVRPLGLETRLVVLDRARSIAVLFICMTLSALAGLRDQWSNGQLKDIVESLFTFLSRAPRTVRVKRLNWPLSDYKRCAEFLISVKGEQMI